LVPRREQQGKRTGPVARGQTDLWRNELDEGQARNVNCWPGMRTGVSDQQRPRLRHLRSGEPGLCSNSAGELFARDLQPAEIAKNRHRDQLGTEEFLGQLVQVFRRDLFDAFDQFIEGEEVVEVHLLTGEV